jgi:hypothetical protein
MERDRGGDSASDEIVLSHPKARRVASSFKDGATAIKDGFRVLTPET